jgi:hypothetical protein
VKLSFDVLPSLTSLSANSGPVAGSQLTLNGVGFDVQNPKVNAVSASYIINPPCPFTKGQPNPNGETCPVASAFPIVTPVTISKLVGNSATVIMPPSPFPGNGSGSVSLTVKVNGLVSNALQYQYGAGAGIMPYHPLNPFNFVSGVACAGCSKPANTGIWLSDDAAAGNAGNYIMISGQAADTLRQTYTVGAVDATSFSQLYGDSASVLMQQNKNVGGTFVGSPVAISLTAKPGVVAPITDSAMAVFTTPPSNGEEYQIVHIGQVGPGLRWVAVKGATAAEGGASIQAPVSETGIYAVVSMAKQ